MNRQEFFDELRAYLKILQDEEQEDILAEYSQHIEMKMKSGLSEEEAIGDFGPVKELAGQILEAYHVKPEYESDRTGKSGQIKKLSAKLSGIWPQRKGTEGTDGRKQRKREGGGDSYDKKETLPEAGLPEKIWKWIRMAAAGVGNGIQRTLEFFRRQFRKPFLFIRKKADALAVNAEERRMEREAGRKQQLQEYGEPGERTGKGRGILGSAGSFFKNAVRMAVWIAAACCRLVWNAAVICGAGFFGLLGLLFLFLFGMLAVLWIQGYPLAGLVCCCFGAVLCCGSLTLLGGTFFWRKKRGEK